MDKPRTYESAGVNIERAESFVNRLKKKSSRVGHNVLWKAAGGYAAIYPVTETTGVAVTTDGVGTKLLVANELSDHSTIGIDLVAMCANDLICVGATPTIFLDYFAIGKLEDGIADQIIDGIVEGCDQANMLLAGGETAEMPGLYNDGHYDLAGFAVGQVEKNRLLVGENVQARQTVIGVASSGIHSNGLSLARKLLTPGSLEYRELLTPTMIYVQPVVEILARFGKAVTGAVHVTGGGWRNLFRLNGNVGFKIDTPLPVPAVLEEISTYVSEAEMYKTFNMGMGLCLMVKSNADEIVDVFNSSGYKAQIVGKVTDQAQSLILEPKKLVIKD